MKADCREICYQEMLQELTGGEVRKRPILFAALLLPAICGCANEKKVSFAEASKQCAARGKQSEVEERLVREHFERRMLCVGPGDPGYIALQK